MASKSFDREYPWEPQFPIEAFEAAADRFELSPRRRQVVFARLIGLPLTTIADDLGISLSTVEDHDAGMRTKVGHRKWVDCRRRFVRAMGEQE